NFVRLQQPQIFDVSFAPRLRHDLSSSSWHGSAEYYAMSHACGSLDEMCVRFFSGTQPKCRKSQLRSHWAYQQKHRH
ncbi:hypothetical protein, partial [Pseudomonas amygdali]|uniref:hypothetical protein n=1 Tax=Pseudomonas amygdali TaxID=47877 RepID=UPI00195C87A8